MAGIMYYTVYKTTNKVNGKIYIGCHKTKVIDDGYIGSGTYLRRAIDKHGIENFEKEILAVFDKSSDMFKMESELVNEDFVKDDTNYNLKVGGLGGWDHINNSDAKRSFSQLGRKVAVDNGLLEKAQKSLSIKRENPDWLIEVSENLSKGVKIYYQNGGIGGFKDKSHTPESKNKIGSANSIHQKGEGNSGYGTMWIYNPVLRENKKIKKDDPIPEGWIKGRKMKFSSEKNW